MSSLIERCLGAARLDGRMVGLTHYLSHPSVWYGHACYLADLYVDETARGRSVGKRLMAAIVALINDKFGEGD
jgi:GNAT superfamily N-acetyltransferase